MKFRLLLKSFDKQLMQVACQQLQQALQGTDCKMHGVVCLPTRIRRFCVLRSPHVDKDSREHFEVRISKRLFDLETDSPNVFSSLLETTFPSGVACSLRVIE